MLTKCSTSSSSPPAFQGLPGKVSIAATDDLSAVTTADSNIFISYRWFETINYRKRGQEDNTALEQNVNPDVSVLLPENASKKPAQDAADR